MSFDAIVGGQWGDEGKGKIVDLLSKDVDVVARYQGGANAGHTVYKEDKKVVLHQIPTGALRESCTCVLGNGIKLAYLVSGGLYRNLKDYSLQVKENEIFLITSNKKIIKTSTKIQRTLRRISKLIRVKKIKLVKPIDRKL